MTRVSPLPITHIKARSKHPAYPHRQSFEDRFVAWGTPFPEYNPIEFTDPVVIANDSSKKKDGWADAATPNQRLINSRHSYCGKIRYNKTGRPLNPVGRTGMSGRGLLGKWGPNFAADPIVTRVNPKTNNLEVIVVKRSDTGEWALPGGMVDPGESVSATIKREFGEEALASLEMTEKEKHELKVLLDDLFQNGKTIFQGYVDDPRNTDHAWLESRAMMFHCSESLSKKIKLKAGDDATDVRWLQLDNNDLELEKLYASHKDFILGAAACLHAPPKRSAFSCFRC